MTVESVSVVIHRNGGLFSRAYLALCASLLAFSATAQEAGAGPQPSQQLSQQQIAELKAKANSGDALSQFKLGHAYQRGTGVPKNDELAYKWLRKAAEQGNADAEDSLGTLYRLGEGVALDKGEAVRWYRKAAHGGSANGMFNLGTCYFNGDGVNEDELTAYVWFVLGQNAGSPLADAAAKRSAATASKGDTADAYQRISEMYEKGDELPKDDAQALRWLQKAAKESPAAKVALATHWLNGPEPAKHYSGALELCKAAAAIDYAPALNCLGEIYRKGLGVNRNLAEAVKWYQKAAPFNAEASHALGQIYAVGEGTKADRPEAFMMFFQAGLLGMKTSLQEAVALWEQMDASEQRKTAGKLRDRRFDPDKVIAFLKARQTS